MRSRPISCSLVAVTAIVALLAMHGVSGHGGLEFTSSESTHVAASLMPLDLHDELDNHHDTDHHDDGPCDCPHGTAAICALIILSIIVAARRTRLSSLVHPLRCWRPALPTWSPDPPIPRFRLLVPTR